MAQGNRRTEHSFARVPQATIPRSQFNRSHTHKSTFDSGLLVPIICEEVIPGDTWNLNASIFARLITPIFPTMDNMMLDLFFFFVPYRLVWDNWQKFCGEQTDPGDSTDFTIPQVVAHVSSGFPYDSVMDYMGIPPKINSISVNSLPFRSYNLIWNEWFRDQNLQDSLNVAKGNGPDTLTHYQDVQRRGKRHDYFTSCLPWPQKQLAGIDLPLGTSAPVDLTITGHPSFDIGTLTDAGLVQQTPTGFEVYEGGDPGAGAPTPAVWNDLGFTAEADLSAATAATINTLRQAFQIQKLLERDARGGTRYVELVKSHFGVTSPDARLQRPEYLGGGSAPLMIHTVPQSTQKTTVANWNQDEKGSLSAFGTVGSDRIGFTKSFVEHGTIIGLVCARADLTYQQGLHRKWSRSTRYDFYWPAFANLGEAPVLNQEIWVQDPSGPPGDTENIAAFGYQERWAEYRYSPSYISGLFRSDRPTSLDAWHLAQDFFSLPVLGDTFIKETPPVGRITAVVNEPHFLFDAYFSIKCARTMPVYSIPGLIDHF